jgi:Zn finger protein HypA/HybF involved in hydrogenase expression
MHDTVIANSILRDLEKYGDVKEATLEVGELFGIEPEHLYEHLKEVSEIKFNISQSESRVKCSCGYAGRAKIVERMHDFVLYECPKCGSNVDVLVGDNIIIKEVKV